MNIFVASLNFKTTETQLKSLFEKYGEVESVKIIKDRETNRSKGFGFVVMPDSSEGRHAVSQLNKSEFDGRTIAVQEATEKKRK